MPMYLEQKIKKLNTGNDFCCLVCTIPDIDNGITSQTGKLNAGETVTFNCRAGYTLAGEKNLTCLMDETFSAEIPSCNPSKDFLFCSKNSQSSKFIEIMTHIVV